MQNIVRLDTDTLIELYEAATRADAEHKSFRINTGQVWVDCQGIPTLRNFIQWDVGNTGWTLPHLGEES